jgi:DNA-binding transcriptional regulator YhcF (GntR family)
MIKKSTKYKLECGINNLYKSKIISHNYNPSTDNKSLSVNQKQLALRLNMAVKTIMQGLSELEKDKVIRVGNKLKRDEKVIYITNKQHNKILNGL